MSLQFYCRNSNFVTKVIGDELILVPLVNNVAQMNKVFTLNEVAAFIWNSLESPLSFNQLVEKIMVSFEIDIETAEADLNKFLKLLLENNVIVAHTNHLTT